MHCAATTFVDRPRAALACRPLVLALFVGDQVRLLACSATRAAASSEVRDR